MMIHRKHLEELLQRPLGPYRDHDVLHETACQMKGGVRLVLYSFILEHNGNVIGLDESERPLDGEDNRTFRFRGVLKIADPDWLSEFGLRTVETELNQRATERSLREGERALAHPLTLETLFDGELLTRSRNATWQKADDDLRLTLLIQGERNMPATFMQSSLVPDGLLWSSKAHDRMYEVDTMHVATYSLSQNFFWRWRLWTLMENIDKRFPYVSAAKRMPMWFVEKYLALYACPPEDKHQRLIFNESDSDMDAETGKTVTPRHLLIPHKSEIFGLFAAQADWLVTHNLKRNRLFDTSSWTAFARRVPKERKEAARQGVRWGWPEGQEEMESSEGDSCEEDIQTSGNRELAHRLAEEQPVIGKTKAVVARKLEIDLNKQNHVRRTSVSSSSASDENDPANVIYASDFSEPSADVEENDSDYLDAEEEAVDRIPWQLQQPPLLPDIDARWWCPLPACKYEIDLFNLVEEEGGGIPEIGYILQKQWRSAAYDDKVVQGFGRMVTSHYLTHLEEQGVKLERRNGKTRYTLIDNRRQRGGLGPIRGPMPPRGTLGGESRVVPILHMQAG